MTQHAPLGVAERTHVLQAGEVVLVLDHGGGLQVQDLLHLLTDVKSSILIRVVAVPHRDEVLAHADMHADAHNIRLLKEFSDGGEHHVLPHLAQHGGATVLLLLHFQDPAPTLGKALPHGGNVGT